MLNNIFVDLLKPLTIIVICCLLSQCGILDLCQPAYFLLFRSGSFAAFFSAMKIPHQPTLKQLVMSRRWVSACLFVTLFCTLLGCSLPMPYSIQHRRSKNARCSHGSIVWGPANPKLLSNTILYIDPSLYGSCAKKFRRCVIL